MIFITLGSQKFQFNRLLIEIDRLVQEKKINEPIFAQIGYSDYMPKNYEYKKFLDRDEFEYYISICNKVITHGGTGAIIGSIKKGKKVIAVPRLKEFNEHVDNHQIEIVDTFSSMKFISTITKLEELEVLIGNLDKIKFNSYESNTHNIISSLNEFIEDIETGVQTNEKNIL
ncbi:beta(1,3)galactosyltransferase EpsH [Terrisporobacter petrolearius]|uniref:PssE/Cps14G family polysaccharide biosynthesis glycosyltransferase n=1 Tax=Terrisporobacter petrolearius TaxID=1460447 RepID=UPI001D15FF95|nr:PssE/Cps14G family polysaccharide biosynthesis glycosyltransferase [Terrisporobacter petrolearius]MCC3862733.1 beta(1,3)galactosyltransferase EpsH [Terrisporobacter petrolearius]